MDPIDRLTPARRPDRRAVMRQEWRQLLFLHWEVPADPLRALLPAGLELDRFEGRAFVGLVPFAMTGVRPVGLPAVPPLSNFLETNVRTYVHRAGRDPGVWFFSLDAANRVAVQLARTLFHLPYFHARMGLTEAAGARPVLTYTSDRLRWPRAAATAIEAAPTGPARPATVDTLDHFLIERYLLYAEHRGRLDRGQVHHPPYPVQPAEVLALDETLLAAAGIDRPAGAPLAHFARGVDVEVFPLDRVH